MCFCVFTDPQSETGQTNTFTRIIFIDVLIIDLDVLVGSEITVFVLVDLFYFVRFEFRKEMDSSLFVIVVVMVGFGEV